MTEKPILHVRTGRIFDMTDPGPGFDPIWDECHGACHWRPPGQLACLRDACLEGRPYTPDRADLWLCFKVINGKRYAAHGPSSGGRKHRIGGMTPEHRAQQDEWVRVAEHVGYPAELEVRYPGLRADVVIKGPAATVDVEYQRSPLRAADVVRRANKATGHGLVPLWHSLTAPAWSDRVPTLRTNDLTPGRPPGWQTVVGGPRLIVAKRCHVGNFATCPESRRHCGRFHPWYEPMTGLRLLDLAEQVPAGALVPLDFSVGRVRHAFLVTPEGRDRYTELAGARPVGDGDREPPRPVTPRESWHARERGIGVDASAAAVPTVGLRDTNSRGQNAVAERSGPYAGWCRAHRYWPADPCRCAVPTCPAHLPGRPTPTHPLDTTTPTR